MPIADFYDSLDIFPLISPSEVNLTHEDIC